MAINSTRKTTARVADNGNATAPNRRAVRATSTPRPSGTSNPRASSNRTQAGEYSTEARGLNAVVGAGMGARQRMQKTQKAMKMEKRTPAVQGGQARKAAGVAAKKVRTTK